MEAPVLIPATKFTAELKLKGFKAYKTDIPRTALTTFSRRHYYKIVLSTGHVVVHFADRILDLDGTYLFFANPHIPFAVDMPGQWQTGYSCTFTEEFIKPLERSESLQQSPLFKVSSMPAFKLNGAQQEKIEGIFKNMIDDQGSDYQYKEDLMRNYIHLIIHEALRMQPHDQDQEIVSASLRLTNMFLDLLERQFPVENQQARLTMKTAQDYADRLSVHVNYLNRAVKGMTGKPTTAHIADRVIMEAVTMLEHTDWSVADIAYSLGFEYANYFSNFFKKMTGKVPKAYRLS
jgi:AraC family transcriptional activator of pobA